MLFGENRANAAGIDRERAAVQARRGEAVRSVIRPALRPRRGRSVAPALDRSPGLPQEDVQRKAHRRVLAGGENKSLMRGRVHDRGHVYVRNKGCQAPGRFGSRCARFAARGGEAKSPSPVGRARDGVAWVVSGVIAGLAKEREGGNDRGDRQHGEHANRRMNAVVGRERGRREDGRAGRDAPIGGALGRAHAFEVLGQRRVAAMGDPGWDPSALDAALSIRGQAVPMGEAD